MGEVMSEQVGVCCLCRTGGVPLIEVADAWVCETCESRIPWECKTARYSKGVGFENKFAEKYILKKMRAQQLKSVCTFLQLNEKLAEGFSETDFIPESGLAIDGNNGLLYFDVKRAKLNEHLKAALLYGNEPVLVFRVEWIERFWLDYAYYKTPKRDGSALYYPQYAQIVLSFKNECLSNKSVRLDIEQPALVELMLRKHYENAARPTLEALERLTGLERGPESKTYYEGG